MTTLGKRLKELRKEKGYNAARAAREIGIKPPSLHGLESGRSQKPKGETLAGIIMAYGTTAKYVLQGMGPKHAKGGAAEQDDGRVPVVGTAQAGNDGYWEELQYPTGHGEGFVRYPTRDKNAYAIRVKGDSMRPRIKPGEFLLIEPNSAIVPGEEVLVTTIDGRSMVKVLGPRREGTVELHSINEDHRPITLDESTVRTMHYVSAIVKSGRYYRDET